MIALIVTLALLIAPHTPSEKFTVRTLQGIATWYDAAKNGAWYTQKPRAGSARLNQNAAPYKFYAAAGPLMRKLSPFKWGAQPYRVLITNLKTGVGIIVWVVDTCACKGGAKEKLIDLSPAAFTALGVGLGNGVQRVRAEILTPYYSGGR